MGPKARLELGSGTGTRKRLAAVKLVFSRVGPSLLLVRLLFWWREFSYERSLWKPWPGRNREGETVKTWTWGEIKPLEDTIWHQCYEQYDCAQLEVPLDWLDPAPSHVATIAIIRYNATDGANYKGPIFINPGGPGGSGIWFIKHLAPYYQSVVGKNHDIISFDPRGIGATTPPISCWNSSTTSSISPILWDIQEPPVLDAHPGVLYDAYAHASAFSQQCASIIGSNEYSVGRYVSTASVARDMLHIIEKLGEEKLKYWGFSYGIFLGVTFASMWPEKMGLMVLDGNVDAEQYSSGEGTHYLTDTDAVTESFYTYCHQAGPKLCAFHDSSPSAVETRLTTLLAKLKTHPVIVPIFIFKRKTRDRNLQQSLAEALAALESGDGRPFLELSSQGQEELPLCDSNHGPEPGEPSPEIPEVEGSADASRAILCSDQAPLKGGVEAFGEYLQICESVSKSAGATMASMRLGCAEWGVKAKWRFSGPFRANVSTPILFVGNMADNITPLLSAYQNAKGFPNSVVLKQNFYGHTSLSMLSRCTAKTIRAYFQDGTLPAEGTVCEGDLVPFEPWNATYTTEPDVKEDHGDAELDVALMELMKAPIFSA